MSALDFLREYARQSSRLQLGIVSGAVALGAAVAIAGGAYGLHGWFAVAGAIGMVVLDAGLFWWLLGLKRVQEWIRSGWL